MPRDQLVEPADTFHTLRQPPAAQLAALLILDVHVMMSFRQSTPTKII